MDETVKHPTKHTLPPPYYLAGGFILNLRATLKTFLITTLTAQITYKFSDSHFTPF
jgi:hypothetical protein